MQTECKCNVSIVSSVSVRPVINCIVKKKQTTKKTKKIIIKIILISMVLSQLCDLSKLTLKLFLLNKQVTNLSKIYMHPFFFLSISIYLLFNHVLYTYLVKLLYEFYISQPEKTFLNRTLKLNISSSCLFMPSDDLDIAALPRNCHGCGVFALSCMGLFLHAKIFSS